MQFFVVAALLVVASAAEYPAYPKPAYPSYPAYPKAAYPEPAYPKPAYPAPAYPTPSYPAPAYPAYPKTYDYVRLFKIIGFYHYHALKFSYFPGANAIQICLGS